MEGQDDEARPRSIDAVLGLQAEAVGPRAHGAADNTWSNTGIEIDSEAQVLQTPAMVGLDWQRTVVDPRVLPCVRSGLADQIPNDQGALVSLERVSFPKVGGHASAFGH